MIVAGVTAFAADMAAAQSASQLPLPSSRPQAAPAAPIVIPETAGPQAPAGAELQALKIDAVTVEGAPAELAPLTARIMAPLRGQRVTVAALFAAARDLERAYVDSGRLLARVVVPAQTLIDGGTVRLVVVDGRFGQIDVRAVPDRVRERVAALLAPLAGRPGVTLAEVERRLTLAADVPGIALTSTLAPGTAPGETVLLVAASHRPIAMQASWDNSLAPALGRSNAGLGVDLNGVIGLGEQVYLRAFGHPAAGWAGAAPRNRQLLGGVLLPLGRDGTLLNLEAVLTRATPETPAGAPRFGSRFSRASVRLRHPLLRRRAASLWAEAGFDFQTEALDLLAPLAAPLSQDRLRVARVAFDGFAGAAGGTLSGRATLSQGLMVAGARAPTVELPLSRQGAAPDFTRAEMQLRFDRGLARHAAAMLQARGQTSFGRPLPRAEQFIPAGPGQLSGFDSGSIQGDSGWLVRAELLAPFARPRGRLAVTPYGFAAISRTRLFAPTAVELPRLAADSHGLGLRMAVSPRRAAPAFSLAVEYAATHRNDAAATDNRLILTASLRA